MGHPFAVERSETGHFLLVTASDSGDGHVRPSDGAYDIGPALVDLAVAQGANRDLLEQHVTSQIPMVVAPPFIEEDPLMPFVMGIHERGGPEPGEIEAATPELRDASAIDYALGAFEVEMLDHKAIPHLATVAIIRNDGRYLAQLDGADGPHDVTATVAPILGRLLTIDEKTPRPRHLGKPLYLDSSYAVLFSEIVLNPPDRATMNTRAVGEDAVAKSIAMWNGETEGPVTDDEVSRVRRQASLEAEIRGLPAEVDQHHPGPDATRRVVEVLQRHNVQVSVVGASAAEIKGEDSHSGSPFIDIQVTNWITASSALDEGLHGKSLSSQGNPSVLEPGKRLGTPTREIMTSVGIVRCTSPTVSEWAEIHAAGSQRQVAGSAVTVTSPADVAALRARNGTVAPVGTARTRVATSWATGWDPPADLEALVFRPTAAQSSAQMNEPEPREGRSGPEENGPDDGSHGPSSHPDGPQGGPVPPGPGGGGGVRPKGGPRGLPSGGGGQAPAGPGSRTTDRSAISEPQGSPPSQTPPNATPEGAHRSPETNRQTDRRRRPALGTSPGVSPTTVRRSTRQIASSTTPSSVAGMNTSAAKVTRQLPNADGRAGQNSPNALGGGQRAAGKPASSTNGRTQATGQPGRPASGRPTRSNSGRPQVGDTQAEGVRCTRNAPPSAGRPTPLPVSRPAVGRPAVGRPAVGPDGSGGPVTPPGA